MSIRAIEHHSKWNTVPCLPKWNFYSLLRTYCCGFSWRKLPYDAKTFRFMVCIVWMVSTRWSCSKITIFLLKIEVKKGKAKCRNDFTELWALSRFLPVHFLSFFQEYEKKIYESPVTYVVSTDSFKKTPFKIVAFWEYFSAMLPEELVFLELLTGNPDFLTWF